MMFKRLMEHCGKYERRETVLEKRRQAESRRARDLQLPRPGG